MHPASVEVMPLGVQEDVKGHGARRLLEAKATVPQRVGCTAAEPALERDMYGWVLSWSTARVLAPARQQEVLLEHLALALLPPHPRSAPPPAGKASGFREASYLHLTRRGAGGPGS